MLSEDLKSICVELATLAGYVDEPTWEKVRLMKSNLEALAASAEDLEKGVIRG